MVRNSIRTSADMATIAAHTLSGDFEQAFCEFLAQELVNRIREDQAKRVTLIEDLAQSLAGSVLSNRRA